MTGMGPFVLSGLIVDCSRLSSGSAHLDIDDWPRRSSARAVLRSHRSFACKGRVVDRNPANRQDGNEGRACFVPFSQRREEQDRHRQPPPLPPTPPRAPHRPPNRHSRPHGSLISTTLPVDGIAVAPPSSRPCRRRRINHTSTGAVTRPSSGHTPSETVNRRRSIGEFAFHQLRCRTTTPHPETARTRSAVAPTMFAVSHLLGAAAELQHDACTWGMI